MKIEVTEEDINLGEKHQCSACPIARAVARVTERYCEVFPSWVTGGTLYLTDQRTKMTIGVRLAAVANRFTMSFDAGYEDLKPFTFELIV